MKRCRLTFVIALIIPFAALSAEVPAPSVAPAVSSRAPSTAPAAPPRKADRLDLETSVVIGNRELPKVLYIVPWKKAELGDLPEQPFNTLLDEALTPLDRDEFRREVSFHSTLSKRQISGPAGPVATPDESGR